MRRVVTLLLAVLTAVTAMPSLASAEVPPGVEAEQITTYFWDQAKRGGVFRSDGSSPYDDSGQYDPQVGDRRDVEFREGWRLTFYNVGELGGEEYATASLDFVREHVSPGVEVVEVGANDGSGASEPGYKIAEEPASGTLDLYEQPVFTLRFTGGPDGTFTQVDGPQVGGGAGVTGAVSQGEDGLSYVALKPLYVRMRIEDPDAFAGWPGMEPGSDGDTTDTENVAGRLTAFSAPAALEYPDGSVDRLATQSADPPTTVPVGTVITTSQGGYVALEYVDGSTLELGPWSEAELTGRTIDDARLNRGAALLSLSEELVSEGGAAIELALGQLTAVPEGAGEWSLSEDVDQSGITVLDGTARVMPVAAADSVEVASGEMVVATAEGLGNVGPEDVAAVQKRWESARDDATPIGASSLAWAWWTIGFVAVLAAAGAVWALFARRGRAVGEERSE